MRDAKKELEHAVPFAMEPVVYDFAINNQGTAAKLTAGPEALLPAAYYTLVLPRLLRHEARRLTPAKRAELESFGAACQRNSDLSGMASVLMEHLLPRKEDGSITSAADLDVLLNEYGFDAVQHEKVRSDLRSGRIGLAQNALRASTRIEDVRPGDIQDARSGLPERFTQLGADALRSGTVAVVSLAGGIGSRWTRGAGVVKAINPFCRLDGKYRNFVEIHLAKSRRVSRTFGKAIPHVFTTSYMTHGPVAEHLKLHRNYGYEGPVYVSPGRNVGLRLIPMARDLRFMWEEMPQQVLDEQKQKMRESARAGLIDWAMQMGEANDYRDNLPMQCLHPVGHWYELPNLLINGVMTQLLDERPELRYLLLHNVDTLGAEVDAAMLGLHIDSGATLTGEVIARVVEDRGGCLARVDGRLRLVEGMAFPDEKIEFDLSFYNSATMWIDLNRLLKVFGLNRGDLRSVQRRE